MISIIVCTYNRDTYIIKCLDSIAEQSAEMIDYELVIVNNKSTDQTADLISKFVEENEQTLQLSYHIEENQGLSYARNRGIKEAKGNYYVFVDDDAFLDKEYVKSLLVYIEKYGVDDFSFGGKILPFLESELPKWMSPYLMPLMSVIDKGDKVIEFSNKHYPIGANMGMSKKSIDEIGDFNVELGRVGKNLMGGEEKDLFVRMKNAGYKIYYFPNSFVHHVVPDSRLTIDFIRNQGIGVGKSERIRVQNEGGFSVFKRRMIEFYKWGGSIMLFFMYFFSGQLSKGKMIIKFRWWVTKGLLLK